MNKEKFTIAVLADIHYGAPSPAQGRRCNIADILLQRAVYRLNRLIRPDVTLVLGDVIDDGNSPDAENNLQHLRKILDKLDSPYIAIPGNHDADSEMFFRVFDRPEEIVDIGGIRLLPFVDQQVMPGYKACRSPQDLDRISQAADGFDGVLVSLQHVCLFPPSDPPVAPYNYTNADELVKVMQEAGLKLSISGHHHRGAEDTLYDGITFVNAPGLCESPFPFLEITIEGDHINTKRHELKMPEELQLIDNHLHSQMAFCGENMMVDKAISLAGEFGLSGVTFSEHSGHVYFGKSWNGKSLQEGMKNYRKADSRMSDYLKLQSDFGSDFARFGLEIDFDFHGKPIFDPADLEHFDFLSGAVHGLAEFAKDNPDQQALKDEFLFITKSILASGIVKVLAHPFRVFRRGGMPTPDELFDPVVEMLLEHGVAAEINFHTNEPPLEFIRECLDEGVKFSLGSDSHNLAEIGDFAYHLKLLNDAGFDGDLADIIITK